MAEKRKLDTTNHGNKPKKKCKISPDVPCHSNQQNTGQTTHSHLTNDAVNSASIKCREKDGKVSAVDVTRSNGRSESGVTVKLTKVTKNSSISKRKHSYMKRTHQDKVKQKKKHKTSKSAAVKLPEAPEEISANWKNLLKTLTTTRKAEKKPLARSHRQTTQNAKQPSESTPIIAAPDIWFDDVDEIFIEKPKQTVEGEKPKVKLNPLVRPNSFEGLTKAVAMDCEMVGVGSDGQDSILARVSIVNQFGQCIYDTFVKPTESVTDYRTHVSGVRPKDLAKAPTFEMVQKKVSDILKTRVLVGHALHNDLQVLFLDHPRKKIRDTARYKPYRSLFNGANPSLKKLTEKVLGVKVQEGEHSSVQDAQAAMRLYTYHKKQWEKEIASRFKKFKKTPKTTNKQNTGSVTTD